MVLSEAADVDDVDPRYLLITIGDRVDPTRAGPEAANHREAGLDVLVVVRKQNRDAKAWR